MFKSLKVDDIYTCDIISLENDAKGVAKINNMVVFVPKALSGEKVRVRITKIKKNYAFAKLIEVINKSESRVVSKCPYYDVCGGCNLRHQKEDENLAFKKEKVKIAINKIGKINIQVDDVVSSLKNDNYRNKASFKVENDKIGFYEEETYRLVDIKSCMLLDEKINESLKVIRNYISKNKNSIYNLTIKLGNAKDEILIDILSLDKTDFKIKYYLINNISNLKTIIFNNKIVYGDGYISQISNGLLFNCSAKSFFQVNNMQAEKLYNLALKQANLSKDDVVLDLYSGTGTISLIVSSYVKKVIGVEIVKDAVLDAKKNMEINSINNVYFYEGNVNKVLNKINDKIDVIFTDPPRSGMDKKSIQFIKKINPNKIIYISCNPVTLARDLNLLNNLYEIKKIIPVDMFPNTSHVECVCLLELR